MPKGLIQVRDHEYLLVAPERSWQVWGCCPQNWRGAGVGAGESEPMHQKLSARDPDPGKKPQRQAREKHIRRFLDMAALFQIPNCLSKLNSGTSVLHVPAEEIGHSKTQLSPCHLIICTVLLVSHFLVWHILGWFGESNMEAATPLKAGEWEPVCACLHSTAYLNLSTGRSIAMSQVFPPGAMPTAAQHSWFIGFCRFPTGFCEWFCLVLVFTNIYPQKWSNTNVWGSHLII